ncbi:hypothetical protein HYFRA_00008080 [Hymenoscyphus fraxineus]|uniref:Uncharacterized protein n=1 Tax=Hymenoscyphus fraxineus TaxID=746836 RepID=A0A9N9KSH8_9HELO|nr:hypothetical protein HYFRA_00008080 [Hymenoscyphus fraxineus]
MSVIEPQAVVLSIHIVAGILEISLWYFFTLVKGQRPTAGTFEFMLCLTQSITSLILVKHLARGYPILTRPSYQSGSVCRLIAAGIALYSQSPDWHESATKSVNAFVYTRLLIFYVGPLMKTSHEDTASPQEMYNFAVIVGAILALAEGPIRNISSTYVVLVVLNAAFQRWSSEMAAQPHMDASEKVLVQSLLSSGFVERETINKVQPDLFVAPQPGDEYIDKKDSVNHDMEDN